MRSTSALYPSYPYHQNQSSDENPYPGFADQHYEQFTGPLYSVDPSYSTSGSYSLHQNQIHNYGVNQSSMTNDGPFSYPGFTSHPPQEALTYPVLQPAATQVQEQQVLVKRNAEEEDLLVKMEPPKSPNSRPRLIWTPELHERFIQAAMQLGGLFKATPKAILGKMNVKGLTADHVKSHLQRMRKKLWNDISAEKIMGHGIQDNADSPAPQVTEVEALSSSRPKFESNIGKYGKWLRSYETPNCQQTLEIAPGDDLADYFNFEDFDLF
ncbi:hypothetical protein AgCh_000121 [Apium graveolens]